MESDGSFLMHDGKDKKTRGETELKNWVCGKVKIHIITPSRAYAYARITGVFVFLLSQVSQVWKQDVDILLVTMWLWMRFNKWGVCPSEINLKMQRKRCVLSLVFGDISAILLNFELFSLGIFLLVWHLWQQKINIAVGRRACTRVREKEKHNDAVFCHLHYAKRWCRKIFYHFFLDFSLFGAISTPIYLGTQSSCALPIFNSTFFTAKANPIY